MPKAALSTLADPARMVLCILAVGVMLMIARAPASAQTASPVYEAEHVGPDGIASLDGSKPQAGANRDSSLGSSHPCSGHRHHSRETVLKTVKGAMV